MEQKTEHLGKPARPYGSMDSADIFGEKRNTLWNIQVIFDKNTHKNSLT